MPGPPAKTLDALQDLYPPVPPTKIPTPSPVTSGDNIWYLAYGSNLCSSVFIGRRKIKPLEKINVFVPSLRLTFDLPGAPYLEPRFANTKLVLEDGKVDHFNLETMDKPWTRGLIGVAYLITRTDLSQIVATEGTSYQDIVVECIELADGDRFKSTGTRIQAHTLCSPESGSRAGTIGYPSLRYMNLLRVGAKEHSLPAPYLEHLNLLPHYSRTSKRQFVGLVASICVMAPPIILMLILRQLLRGKDGKPPAPVAKVLQGTFRAGWGFYDNFLKPVFGDGERTEK